MNGIFSPHQKGAKGYFSSLGKIKRETRQEEDFHINKIALFLIKISIIVYTEEGFHVKLI